MTPPDAVAIADLHKSYPAQGKAVPVLAGLSLALRPGETVALTGESGSGKSTLLHLIAGLDSADSGQIRVLGHDMAMMSARQRADLRRTEIAIIFQSLNLIPSLTVAENIAFHARLARRHDADLCAGLVAQLGLEGLEARLPEHLSGGQRQRVAIGRALAMQPRLLLADEPTGNLDETTSDRVIDALLGLVAERGCGLLMVTHSRRLAGRLSRHLHLRAGRIDSAGAGGTAA